VHDEIERLARHVAIGAVVAVLVLLARGEREAQRAFVASGRGAVRVRPTGLVASPARKRYQYSRSGSSPSHRRAPNGPTRATPFRARGRDAPERVVVRDLPLHFDRLRRHAPACERLRREPRPEA
jgi:hypothetical protein